ncbi:MAG: Hg(II)-responsive transcriptional regulator [Halomonas sp.]|nr:Hg(II)-responsive transcriptional regulator [Halomonas sp.]
MPAASDTLTIGAFARTAGVNVETIRFYQHKGLLRTPERPPGSIRRYDSGDVARVTFVKAAQRLGFSLDEIRQLLALEDGAHCCEVAELASQRLDDVRARLADLARIEAALSRLVDECHAHRGEVSCPLIAALQDCRGKPEAARSGKESSTGRRYIGDDASTTGR